MSHDPADEGDGHEVALVSNVLDDLVGQGWLMGGLLCSMILCEALFCSYCLLFSSRVEIERNQVNVKAYQRTKPR